MDSYIGLDLGGTSLKYGIVNAHGDLLIQLVKHSKADQNQADVLSNLEHAVKELMEYAEKNRITISGVGLGTPGVVNIKTGALINISPNFSEWGNVNIKEMLEKTIALPFYIDNDANLAALGEYHWVIKKRIPNLLYITIGTGIGGGIIIDGNLFRGSGFSGAEIGHIHIDYNGIKCNCGGTGCWEQYASTRAMLEFYNARTTQPVENAVQFFKRVKSGEPAALEILEREYFFLAVGLSTLLNVLNPEMVILGGGISESPLFHLDRIEEIVRSRAMKNNHQSVQFSKAGLGNNAGVLGAAAFAREMMDAGASKN